MDSIVAEDRQRPDMSRRHFMVVSSTLAGAFTLGMCLPGARAAKPAKEFAPNAYIRLDRDGNVTFTMIFVEMGQGTYTAIPMLIAEELDVDLAQVKLEIAPADEKRYSHPLYGLQTTGGSSSIRAGWGALRQAGATARAMLVTAASKTWNVDERECTTRVGTVFHERSGRKLSYGELAEKAAALPMPPKVAVKDPAQFKLIGTSVRRLDTPGKVNGTAEYGIDVRLPGMKVAAIANCPFIGGRLKSLDPAPAKAIPGVVTVLQIDTAYAVVADHLGAARKALALLRPVWDSGPHGQFSNEVWESQLKQALAGTGRIAFAEGDFKAASAQAAKQHQAVYMTPPLAHTTMEPLNCTIHARKNECEVWLGSQAPARVQRMVADVLGLPIEKVVVHNYLLGGGFGRKLDADYAEISARFAKQVGYPLKVVYSREEDIQHDAYRPMFVDELNAAIDMNGRITGFNHRFAGSHVIARYAPSWLMDGNDGDAVHDAESPYEIPNRVVEAIRHEPPEGLLTGNWRGVGPTHHAYVNECFIDELAVQSKTDPVEYRLSLLSNKPRLRAVLHEAAQKADWLKPLAKGKGRGVSVVEAWDCCSALVTEVDIGADGTVKVERMVCVLDCGLAINPDGVAAQMEGGIVYGLTAVLYGTLNFENGRVRQGNFHDYPALRMNEMPKVEFHLVKSAETPGGVGEMGTALVAPSVLNAIYDATGKRFRRYPVAAADLKSTS